MRMAISERLQMVIKMNGMTNSTFADKIGVQRSSISHVLAGRNKPSIDFIQKILETFPKVDADWLVTGKKVGKTLDSTIKSPERMSSFNRPVDPRQSESTHEDRSVKPVENQKVSTAKTIQKVLVFYNDGTYEELTNYPRS